MELVGLSGYARSGKDSVAEILVAERGFERRAFADILRRALYALNPIIYGIIQPGHPAEPVRVQEIVDRCGWEGAKAVHPEIRELLQRLGTEAGRNILGDNVWVKAALRDCQPDGKYVFTDCRFPNEADMIRERGGHVVRIYRPGVVAANDHISEIALDHYPFGALINNKGTLDDLRDSVLAEYDQWSTLKAVGQ